VSGEAFYLQSRGYPWFVLDDLAGQLDAQDDDEGPTIAQYLEELGFGQLAGEHRELVARMRRMAAVYRVLCWWLASDSGRETTVIELTELAGYQPDGTQPGPFNAIEVIELEETGS